MSDIPTENLPCPCPRCRPDIHIKECSDVGCLSACLPGGEVPTCPHCKAKHKVIAKRYVLMDCDAP